MLLSVMTPALIRAQCVYTPGVYTCSGNVGTTTLTGTGGSDIFSFLNGVIGQITVTSNGGSDTLDFSSYVTGVNVNLSNSATLQVVTTNFQIFFQGFNTPGPGTTVIGGSGNDIIHGGYGNDTINGNGGNDSLSGGWFDNPSAYEDDNSGSDTIYGGNGNDFIFGGHGNDTLYGGAGDDDIHGYDGVDVVSGDAGNDILHGNNDNDTVYGGTGNDVLTGGLGSGVLDGGPGYDTMSDDALGCQQDIPVNIEVIECGGLPPPIPTPLPAAPTQTGDICITEATRVALVDGTLLVFSDFTNTANGMAITHIPLRSLIAPTDDEKASGLPVWVGYQDSEYAPGWAAAVYWQNSHYGFVIYKDGGKTVYDDTGAICGWF